MIKIICFTSKKGNLCYCLTINGVYVCFNVPTISRACNVPIRDIYLLDSGEYIDIK